MYEDAKEELKRLEKALLEEDSRPEEPAEEIYPEEEPEEPEWVQTQVVSLEGRVYNTDKTDADMDAYAEDVYSGGRKSVSGLVAVALVLAAAILAVLIFWIVRYGGAFL